MADRRKVERTLARAASRAEAGLQVMAMNPGLLAALCRAWLAVDGGHRVYVGRVYDCDAGEDRGEIIRTLPEDLIGFVRIVPEVSNG